MSDLLAAGHQHARHYPIAMVWSEARLVRRREASRIQREGVVLISAIAAALGGGDFNATLKEIGNVG